MNVPASSPWPHDDNENLIAFYGDPESRIFAQQLVPFVPPWQMSYKDDAGKVTPVRHFVVHAKVIQSLQRVFDMIWSGQGKNQANINAIGMQWYGGCYAPRNVRGSSSKLSCHAFAAALDLDPEHNPMNRSHASRMNEQVIAAFKHEGWFWGGEFKTRQDPMHFQAAHE